MKDKGNSADNNANITKFFLVILVCFYSTNTQSKTQKTEKIGKNQER